ncbi:MAG TPA: hypothetical protein VL997_02175 [Dyella sp.]|nr:hypothetical protein [Dyella sp.]
MSDRGRGSRPPSFTRLTNVSKEGWKDIEKEKGASELEGVTVPGAKAKLSRRGSIILSQKNEDGTRTVDILHSLRTARQLEPLPASASIKTKRLQQKQERDASTYRPPDFGGELHGHTADVTRFTWTPQEGFAKVDSSSHHSGKAGGDFGPGTTKALKSLEWPNLDASEKSHHSEAEYAAKKYGPSVKNPVTPPRGGLLVHQMKGFHDMCRNCQEGVSGSIAQPESGNVVTYGGSQPFGSTEEWRKHEGSVISGPGTIHRSRPELGLSPDERQDHMDRAKRMRALRGEGPPSLATPPPLASAPVSEELPARNNKKRTRDDSERVKTPRAAFKPIAATSPLFKGPAKPRQKPAQTPKLLDPAPAKQRKTKEGESPSNAGWSRSKSGRLVRQ